MSTVAHIATPSILTRCHIIIRKPTLVMIQLYHYSTVVRPRIPHHLGLYSTTRSIKLLADILPLIRL